MRHGGFDSRTAQDLPGDRTGSRTQVSICTSRQTFEVSDYELRASTNL